MTAVRAWLAADSVARALGADRIAELICEQAEHVTLTRTGSRGLYFLEPLLELDSDQGRIAFGPLSEADIPTLFSKGLPDTEHPLCLGPVDELDYLARQHRITARRLGVIDPLDIDDYRLHGGFDGLTAALQLTPQAVVDAISESGLRGRGGAAFPTGIKWQTVLDAPGEQKYIVCNADEGDSGTFIDRMLMEGDPYSVIEGMAIAAHAVGANRGYIYCRSEYPQAITTLRQTINTAAAAGWLDHIKLSVTEGAGAYICGEETALLESLEGKRGMVRYRPPLPAIEGLFGQPTVVNNVVSLATTADIMASGSDRYQSLGSDRSRGTLTVQLAGNVRYGGLIEVPFGTPLSVVLEEFGGGTASGRPIKAVQAGGPLGTYIPPSLFDTPLDYEAFKAIGAMIGHGGLVVFDDTADLGAMARFAMEFCAIESCGKCTPCRIGSQRGVEVIDRIRQGNDPEANTLLLHDLCDTMVAGSLCGLGGMAPLPVLSIMEHFPEEL